MKTLLALGLGVGLAMAGVACGSDAGQSSGAEDVMGSGGAGAGFGSTTGSGVGGGGAGDGMSGETSNQGEGPAEAGVLTAGTWDDNRNYAFFTEYLAEMADLSGQPSLDAQERDAAQALALLEPTPKTTLDIALVIDTTSSMSDEIAFLQVEFDALASQIDSLYPNADQRWALVVYRDDTDDYLVKAHPFTDSSAEFKTLLAQEGADGGGDYEEAADRGLEAAMDLSWRGGDTARLMFWLADAPHHIGDSDRVTTAIREAAESDVHIYPVAASGVDERAELTMRSAAQMTLGRYLFLTDDSGVGGSHKEPTIPCYFVTRLDHAILRMIDIEMTGIYREPEPEQIIRTGGDPEDGICQLGPDEIAVVF